MTRSVERSLRTLPHRGRVPTPPALGATPPLPPGTAVGSISPVASTQGRQHGRWAWVKSESRKISRGSICCPDVLHLWLVDTRLHCPLVLCHGQSVLRVSYIVSPRPAFPGCFCGCVDNSVSIPQPKLGVHADRLQAGSVPTRSNNPQPPSYAIVRVVSTQRPHSDVKSCCVSRINYTLCHCYS